MNHLHGFGLFFLAGGAIAVWGGVEQLRRKRDQVRRAVSVNARVLEVQSESGSDPGDVTWYYPEVTFTVDGKATRAKLLKGTPRREDFKSGGTVRVYYDPLNPTQVVTRQQDFPGSGGATVLGAVFVAIGGGLLWAGWGGR